MNLEVIHHKQASTGYDPSVYHIWSDCIHHHLQTHRTGVGVPKFI